MAFALLGSTVSASYVERVNSAGKKIYPVGRKLLGDDITEMFVMLRMNVKFYKYFETNHKKVLLELVKIAGVGQNTRKYLAK